MDGNLYLCSTPIGNLEDITLRVIRTLKEVDLIAAEDTRHTRKLLNHFQINTPLTSYHQHNAGEKGPELVELLKEGKNLALVSDAGTPGISDPGSLLVNLAIEENIPVIPLPGATAAIAALIVSGLPTNRFAFEGFLPRSNKDRTSLLEKLKKEERTLIFYEAPHRLLATLKEIAKVFPKRNMVIARELTKHYEEVIRGTPEEILAHFQKNRPRGEFTLVIQGGGISKEEPVTYTEEEIIKLVKELEEEGWDWRESIKEAARKTGLPRREVYRLVKIK